MLKLILYIIFGLSSLVLIVYTIKSNKPRLTGQLLTSIFIPSYHNNLKKSLLIIYPIIFNNTKNDNSAIHYELEIDCGMGFFQIPMFYGMEDEGNPDYFVIPGPFHQTMLLINIKEKILYAGNMTIEPGNSKHGYLFFALEKGFLFENIIRYKLTITDILWNKFEIYSSNEIMNDVPLFLQKSNAKIYKEEELPIMSEMIEKYYGSI